MKRRMIAFVAMALVGLGALVAHAEEAHDQPPPMDGLTGGERPWERAFDEAMLEGRQAYNAEQRQAARDAFVQAIQILPTQPAPYRNLARNYNLMGDYPAAAQFYEQYLRLAPDAEDREVIEREYRGAASRGGDESWRHPANQRMALRSLTREIDEGRGVIGDGGGAWGLYQVLLGTGYADPQLETIREDLAQKIGEELEEYFRAVDGFLPVLSADDWRLQQQRLDALDELVRDEERREHIRRRRWVVELGTAVLDGAFSTALEVGEEAVVRNSDLPFVKWYHMIALDEDGRTDEALRTVEELLDERVFEGDARQRALVVRAQLLGRLGDHEEAAQIYREILLH